MSESFEGQLMINGEFKSIKPSGGKDPYRWETKEEAIRMVVDCYPDVVRLYTDAIQLHTSLMRYKKVPFKANIFL